jgi:iron-sulfur cluster assembly protein
MIHLTPAAAEEVRRQMENNGIAGSMLRVAVRGGGCSGFSYELDFDDKKDDGDRVFEQNGVSVVCDMKSYLYLNGITIDFEKKMLGGGFRFENPNASGSCGCGTSFSA